MVNQGFKVGETVIAVYDPIWSREIKFGNQYKIQQVDNLGRVRVSKGGKWWNPEAFRKLTPLEKVMK
jgi:hypothetical protein